MVQVFVVSSEAPRNQTKTKERESIRRRRPGAVKKQLEVCGGAEASHFVKREIFFVLCSGFILSRMLCFWPRPQNMMSELSESSQLLLATIDGKNLLDGLTTGCINTVLKPLVWILAVAILFFWSQKRSYLEESVKVLRYQTIMSLQS